MQPSSNPPHLFLIDGYGFVFRAYHVLPPLTNSAGTPVGAVVGFCNMLHKLLDRIRSHAKEHDLYLAVVLDAGQKNFRHDLDTRYKANRPPAPDDLIPQFPLIREATQAFNISAVDAVGFEADDIIATYAKQASTKGMKVTIVSSDKDLMQLIDEQVEMYDPVKDKRIGAKEVEEKFGVPPAKVQEVLALMGDSSDNVPGVPGIGPKTAAELIQTYGTLEHLYERIDEIKQVKRKETLVNSKADAFLSRELVGLCLTAPAPPLEDIKFNAIDQQKLTQFLQLHGFTNLLKRLEKEWGLPASATSTAAPLPTAQPVKQEEAPATITPLASPEALCSWLTQQKAEIIAISHDERTLTAAISPSQAASITLGNALKEDLFAQTDAISSSQLGPVFHALCKLNIPIVGYNVKPWLHLCPSLYVLDIELMLYALQGTPRPAISLEATSLFSLYLNCRQQIAEKQLNRIYWRIDQPVQKVLGAMEVRGIKVDARFLLGLSQQFGSRMAALEQQIYAEAKGEFNIGSPKQLGEVLFERLGFAGGKKSAKSGAYGTDSDVLEALAEQGHNIAKNVLEWRGLSKLKSTYTDALPKSINKQTGRVHTTFNLAHTSTGRLSSIEPNLQNIPIRSTEGKEIRKAFIAEEGNVLISADYSQIELRLLAHMADIPPLKTAFLNGIDIHTQTAAQVFGLKTEDVTSAQRRSAKAINFGIIYGQSAFGLAAGLGIGREEAGAYIKSYFEQFPGIQKYMEVTKAFAREHGYVETLLGRKCYTPLILNKNGGLRQFAERAAINAPLQGTAADIIKKAMIELHELGVNLLLQVHDELIIECPETKAEATAALVKKTMEHAVTLSVPLTVDVSIGKTWE